MHFAWLATVLLVVTGCTPGVESELVRAERALARGDAANARETFDLASQYARGDSDDWRRARIGVARSEAVIAPARAIASLREAEVDSVEPLGPAAWVEVAKALVAKGNPDYAREVVVEARTRYVTSNDRASLDELAKLAVRLRGEHTSPRWRGRTFAPSDEVRELCAVAAENGRAAYERFLALVRERRLSSDDFGALTVALVQVGFDYEASLVLWRASQELGDSAQLDDVSNFLGAAIEARARMRRGNAPPSLHDMTGY